MLSEHDSISMCGDRCQMIVSIGRLRCIDKMLLFKMGSYILNFKCIFIFYYFSWIKPMTAVGTELLNWR